MTGTNFARRAFAALAVAALAATGAFAGTTPLVKVRAASLDAALADAQTLAKSARKQVSREEIVAGIASALGLKDLSFVDFSRPAAAALPLEGMALGAKGFVFAAPVKNAAAALEALEAQAKRFSVEGDVHVFGEGNPIYVRAVGSYLVLGQTRDLVATFDPADALAAGDLPAGSVAASLQITPVAPLIKSGILAAKQKMHEAPAAAAKNAKGDESAAPDEDASSDDDAEQADEAEDDGDATTNAAPTDAAPAQAKAPEAAKPQARPNGAPAEEKAKAGKPANPAAMAAGLAPLMDVYLDAVSDSIDNISEAQVAIEVKGGRALLHERVVPRAGSTLAGFAAAQKRGAAPEVARMLPGDAPMVVFGRWEWTDAMRAALSGFVDRMEATLEKAAAGASDPQVRDTLERLRATQGLLPWRTWVSCQRGEMAGALSIVQDGFGSLSLSRFESRPECGNLVDAALDAAKAAKIGDGVAEETLPPSGIRALVYRVPFIPGPTNAQETAQVEKMFGKGGVVVRLAQVDDVVLTWFGRGGKEPMARALARRATGAAPAASLFAPFDADNGFVGFVNVGAVVEGVGAAKDAKEREIAKRLVGPAGQVTFHAGFDASALDVDVAVPLTMIDAIAGATAEPAAAVPETPAAR